MFTQTPQLARNPNSREIARRLLDQLKRGAKAAPKVELIKDARVKLHDITPLNLREIEAALPAIVPNIPVKTPITNRMLRLTRIVWTNEKIAVTAHGHAWLRSDCTHLATDVDLWLEEKGWPTKEQPNLHPDKIRVVISYDEDSPKPLDHIVINHPWLAETQFTNLSYNSQNPEVPLEELAKIIAQQLNPIRVILGALRVDVESNSLSPLLAVKFLEKSDQFQLKDCLRRTAFGERGSCYGYRHIVLTGKRPEDSAEETSPLLREDPELNLVNTVVASAILESFRQNNTSWLELTIGDLINRIKALGPQQTESDHEENQPYQVPLKTLEEGLESRTRSKAADSLPFPDTVKTPTSIITSNYRKWLGKFAEGTIEFRTTPDGQNWYRIEEAMLGKPISDEPTLLFFTSNGQHNYFHLPPNTPDGIEKLIVGSWVASEVSDPHKTASGINGPVNLLPPEFWEAAQPWFSPAATTHDEAIRNSAKCCTLDLFPKVSIQEHWVQLILERIENELRFITLDTLFQHLTPDVIKKWTLLELVKWSVITSEDQSLRSKNSLLPAIWTPERKGEIISQAPQLQRRNEAWEYCFALPELSQPVLTKELLVCI